MAPMAFTQTSTQALTWTARPGLPTCTCVCPAPSSACRRTLLWGVRVTQPFEGKNVLLNLVVKP